MHYTTVVLFEQSKLGFYSEMRHITTISAWLDIARPDAHAWYKLYNTTVVTEARQNTYYTYHKRDARIVKFAGYK